jgi:phosphinothricin acetyltransferase
MRIRPADASDLEALARIYDHYVVHTAATFDLAPVGIEGRRAWLNGFADEGRHRLLVADAAEGIVGYACSQQLRRKGAYATSVETSIYLEPGVQGRGLGRGLYEALFSALASEDLHRAYAAIALPNAASIRLHERVGFSHVGTFSEVGHKLGRYWDVAWYEKHLR